MPSGLVIEFGKKPKDDEAEPEEERSPYAEQMEDFMSAMEDKDANGMALAFEAAIKKCLSDMKKEKDY